MLNFRKMIDKLVLQKVVFYSPLSVEECKTELKQLLHDEKVKFKESTNFIKSTKTPTPICGMNSCNFSKRNTLLSNPFIHVTDIEFSIDKKDDTTRVIAEIDRSKSFSSWALIIFLAIVIAIFTHNLFSIVLLALVLLTIGFRWLWIIKIKINHFLVKEIADCLKIGASFNNSDSKPENKNRENKTC